MQFTIENEKLVPGIYNFEIIEASDYVSKNNNQMIKIVVKVGALFFSDYLFKSWKIHQVLTAIGLLENLEKGEVLPSELLHKKGKLELINEFDSKYGDRLKIAKYFSFDKHAASDSIVEGDKAFNASQVAIPTNHLTQETFDNDLPF